MKKVNYKQILKHLSNNITPIFKGSVQWQQTVALFDKEIPKQPKNIDGYRSCPNPSCDGEEENLTYDYGYEKYDRCTKCGQALDWNK